MAQAPLTAATTRAVLDSAAAFVERAYVDADTGRRIAQHLRNRQRAGAYDAMRSPAELSEAVTRDLRAINGDLHLGLEYRPDMATRLGRPPAGGVAFASDSGPLQGPPTSRRRIPGEPTPVDDIPPEMRDDPRYLEATSANFGLRRLEILPGNVGYLELESFLGAPGAEHAIEDALRFLERTDAVILDVRENRGGSSMMSHLLASHFLPREPQPTIRVQSRIGENQLLTTIADVAGPRRPDVPLYLLVSRASASAAEEFAFLLKNTRRATLVGERTMGAGHMVQGFDAGHGFVVAVSFTRVSDAKSGREFEVVGVAPDVDVRPEAAMDVAYAAALRQLAERKPQHRADYERLAAFPTVRAAAHPMSAEAMARFVGRYDGGRAIRLRDGRLEYRAGERAVWVPLAPDADGAVLAPYGVRLRVVESANTKQLQLQQMDGSVRLLSSISTER